jgi:hypothetical protein
VQGKVIVLKDIQKGLYACLNRHVFVGRQVPDVIKKRRIMLFQQKRKQNQKGSILSKEHLVKPDKPGQVK